MNISASLTNLRIRVYARKFVVAKPHSHTETFFMQKHPITKYRPFPRIALPDRTWPDANITEAPMWCSVDLRDGNQALAIPMTVDEKLEMFQLLVEIGFKQIEVGFPSAADTEYAFLRKLIEEDLIPEDVTIQVLTQSRQHLIERTFESLRGAKRAIVHLYNSTSPMQREITFRNASREDIKEIATSGTKLIKSLLPTLPNCDVTLEYSPESFSNTEEEYALEVCQAVMEIWEPSEKNKIILNLPATVEYAGPHVYADQIEWFIRNLKNRHLAIISLHTHNDRGCGIAATELALQAGADRVEGTLFGNGERTGNLDINIVALNMYTQGVDPLLTFTNMPRIREVYERCTRMTVDPRHPYAGDLVFTAFSGSHQDAIKKGMEHMVAHPDKPLWMVPYLSIDPQDIGQTYEAIIRINSQSGKGGVAYILQEKYGLEIPKAMHPELGKLVNDFADKESRELSPEEIYQVFAKNYVNQTKPLSLENYEIRRVTTDGQTVVNITADVVLEGKAVTIQGAGNGPINAFVNALNEQHLKDFVLQDFRQHAIGKGSASNSATYISLQKESGTKLYWGCGIHSSIEQSSLLALVSAFNAEFRA